MRRLVLPLLVLLAASARSEPITVYLAGDSTMATKLPEKRPETGWGERLQGFFADDRVRIDNRAKNGRSTRSFIEEGSWQSILDALRAGDYVLIQFGHNDGAKDRPDRYTPPEEKAHEHMNYPDGITDNTHFSPHGAEIMARLAVDGLCEAKVGLVDYVKSDDAPAPPRTVAPSR